MQPSYATSPSMPEAQAGGGGGGSGGSHPAQKSHARHLAHTRTGIVAERRAGMGRVVVFTASILLLLLQARTHLQRGQWLAVLSAEQKL